MDCVAIRAPPELHTASSGAFRRLSGLCAENMAVHRAVESGQAQRLAGRPVKVRAVRQSGRVETVA